jgi:type 1 glutamine amidotransferase
MRCLFHCRHGILNAIGGAMSTSVPTLLRRFSPVALAAGLVVALGWFAVRPAAEAADPPAAPAAAAPKTLKALLVAGGCCHDYLKQKDILKAGIEARAHVEVTIAYNPDTTTRAKFEAYLKDNWYSGYDVIIHDECTSDVKEMEYVENVLAPHKAGIPGVNLHCAMHSYRVGQFQKPVTAGSKDATWFDYLGLQSTHHDWQKPIAITIVDKEHPSMAGAEDWTTVNEELYNNVQLLGGHALAKGKQELKDGKEWENVVVWTNEYGPKKTRVWSTTIGHNNKTVEDARYLDMVTKGLLWSCDKLNDTYLKKK